MNDGKEMWEERIDNGNNCWREELKGCKNASVVQERN